MNDTIAAISTALGVGAISIIRVSGDKSIEIVNKIFDKDLEKVKSHTIVYGHIVDNENIIDEVLVPPKFISLPPLAYNVIVPVSRQPAFVAVAAFPEQDPDEVA